MKMCEVACGLFCHRSKTCTGDLFAVVDSNGTPRTEESIYCRVKNKTIETFKREYYFNPTKNQSLDQSLKKTLTCLLGEGQCLF